MNVWVCTRTSQLTFKNFHKIGVNKALQNPEIKFNSFQVINLQAANSFFLFCIFSAHEKTSNMKYGVVISNEKFDHEVVLNRLTSYKSRSYSNCATCQVPPIY